MLLNQTNVGCRGAHPNYIWLQAEREATVSLAPVLACKLLLPRECWSQSTMVSAICENLVVATTKHLPELSLLAELKCLELLYTSFQKIVSKVQK